MIKQFSLIVAELPEFVDDGVSFEAAAGRRLQGSALGNGGARPVGQHLDQVGVAGLERGVRGASRHRKQAKHYPVVPDRRDDEALTLA